MRFCSGAARAGGKFEDTASIVQLIAIMASLFIARLPTLSNIEVFEAELVVANRYGPYLQHLKSKCR